MYFKKRGDLEERESLQATNICASVKTNVFPLLGVKLGNLGTSV